VTRRHAKRSGSCPIRTSLGPRRRDYVGSVCPTRAPGCGSQGCPACSSCAAPRSERANDPRSQSLRVVRQGQGTADRGSRFSFARAASHGALACSHGGHPHWPALVDRLLLALDDPGDDHWGGRGEFRKRLPPEPSVVADQRLLRKVLRSCPWDLIWMIQGDLADVGGGALGRGIPKLAFRSAKVLVSGATAGPKTIRIRSVAS
jgi:hypothetical protein